MFLFDAESAQKLWADTSQRMTHTRVAPVAISPDALFAFTGAWDGHWQVWRTIARPPADTR
jgi:hypothetical protein